MNVLYLRAEEESRPGVFTDHGRAVKDEDKQVGRPRWSLSASRRAFYLERVSVEEVPLNPANEARRTCPRLQRPTLISQTGLFAVLAPAVQTRKQPKIVRLPKSTQSRP